MGTQSTALIHIPQKMTCLGQEQKSGPTEATLERRGRHTAVDVI